MSHTLDAPLPPFRHDPPTITAGIRVKNGGAHVRPCLDSLSELVDDIVVLDDGSADDTVAICRSYPKVTRLLSWPKSFFHEGADRTVVLAMMADTGADWFLTIDIDEVFEERADLRPFAADPTVGIWQFRRFDFWLCRTHYRIPGLYGGQTGGGHRGMYRNVPGLRYPLLEIHCSVPEGTRGIQKQTGIRIKHYGYADPAAAREKLERYEQLMPGVPWVGLLYDAPQLVEWREHDA